MDLYNDDCFNVFPTIENKSIDLFVLDLPYANFKFGKCTACKWDIPIDLDKMWIEMKRIMKPNAVIIFFCNTKFGYALIDSNPKWFKYDLIWKKCLSGENLIESKEGNKKIKNVKKGDFINSKNGFIKVVDIFYNGIKETHKITFKNGSSIIATLDHKIETDEGMKAIKNINNELILTDKGYTKILKIEYFEKIETMDLEVNHKDHSFFCNGISTSNSRKVGFLSANHQPLRQHENLYIFNDKKATYNPQKTEGHKPRIRSHNKNANCDIVYGDDVKIQPLDTTDKRHPTSILPDDLGIINGGYYRGENGKPFKRMPNDPTTSHPTSILPDIELEEHEKIYVFDGINEDNEDLKKYSKKVFEFIGRTKKQINKDLGHRKAEHFFYFDIKQFGIPILKTYNELIEKYKIDEMEGFIEYKDLDVKYNPQKTEGKEYKSKERTEGEGVYIKGSYKRTATKDTKNRHPTSILPDDLKSTILEYNNPYKPIHRTQKPEKLLEWLIKTYSNEEDLVMDFCMGSGTAGIACKNTNRQFIGIEKDKDIFEFAKKRLE